MIGLKWFCFHCRVALCQKGDVHQCPHCGFTVQDKGGYWDAGMPLKVKFPAKRRNVLATIETNHFWFRPRDILLQLILNRIAPSAKHIIELGCGTGRFLASLQTSADLIVGIDAFENSIQAAASRQKNAIFLHADVCAVPIEDETFDMAVSMDVLEHVESRLFLCEAKRLIRQGGWLLLSVPSGLFLWSQADEKAGHRCRYTLKMISEELETNGWKIGGHTHYQYFLYPLMVISRVFLKGKSRIEKYPPAWMNKLLGLINTLEVRAFSRFSLPLGSSIIVWAQKI
ncbi:MAG: class I SAM-dependent methyltransferase [Candidatus Omnitrophica bacterium]|nr:class I SAM-dependent methyltransferase [Candidatus Omnitrophota bacterium]